MGLSTNAPYNEFGHSMVLRHLEQLDMALSGAGTGSSGDGATQDQQVGVSQNTGDSGGVPDLSGLATIDYVDQQDNDIYEYVDNAIAGFSHDPSVGGDLSGVASNASVIKLRGVSISTTLPSADEQALLYNAPLTKWEPVTLIAANGGVLSKDAGGLIEVAGGTALSVVGNATNTTGSINAIAAASADTVLGRRGTTLTWAKVSKAEMADAAGVSVIGRSANSTGVTADIAGAANQVLACNGTPSLAFSRTITLGDTGNAGSITIGNSTSASAIVISPTLVSAVGRIMSVREIDVCDAGVAKKMLVLASAPY
jgi:hypothetical protein